MPMEPPHEVTPRDQQALAWIQQAVEHIHDGHEGAVPCLEAAILALKIDAGEVAGEELDIDAMPS